MLRESKAEAFVRLIQTEQRCPWGQRKVAANHPRHLTFSEVAVARLVVERIRESYGLDDGGREAVPGISVRSGLWQPVRVSVTRRRTVRLNSEHIGAQLYS